MAKAALAAALLLLLAGAFAENTGNLPPDDQDGSGDDQEDFSGSGAELTGEEQSETDKPTDPSLTSIFPSVATETQHPVALEPVGAEENEAGTLSTTTALETEKPVLDQSTEEVTEEGPAVPLAPTSEPTVQTDTVKITTSPVIVPELHNVPQEATTTTSATQANDPLVNLAHQDTTSTTGATEPHDGRHPHHHHHHHHKTTAASITEPETTSDTIATHAMDPRLHPANEDASIATSATNAIDTHGHGRHAHHHDAHNATEGEIAPDLSTQGAHLIERGEVIDTATTSTSYGNNSKTNFSVVILDSGSEPEQPEFTDSPDSEGSGIHSTDDFVIEGEIQEVTIAGNRAVVNEAQNDGFSETSKGLMEQKGVLAAVIAGGVAGLVFAIGLVGFMLYRMKKKDEGSYCLEDTKQTNGGYEKPIKQEEFYA